MKVRYHQFWQAIWRFTDEYIWCSASSGTLRARVLAILEWIQQLYTGSNEPRKKKWRLLKRFMTPLVFLLLGFCLFLSTQSVVHAQTTTGTSTSVASTASQQQNAADGPTCDTDGPQKKDPNGNAPKNDPLTGLPLPAANGDIACPVAILNACSIDATAPGQNDWLFSGNNAFLLSTQNQAGGVDQFLKTDRDIVLSVALALLAIPFSLAGYQLLLATASSRYAGAVEALSRVILVALVAGLSYDLIQFIIQLENGISSGLYQAMGQPSGASIVVPASNWCQNTQNFIGNLFNLSAYNLQNASGALKGASYSQKTYATTLALINNLPTDVQTLLSVVLVVQLLIRLGLLNFYIILSPLAIICGTVPGNLGRDAAWGWLRGFLSLLFVQALQLMAIGVGNQLFPATITQGTDWFNQTMHLLLPSVIMILTLNIPRLFNVSSTNLLTTLSSSFSRAMSGVILIIRGF